MNETKICNGSVGPLDLLEPIGLSVLVPVYVLVTTLIISVFSYALFHKLKCGRMLTWIESFQIIFPSIHLFITSLPLFSPVLYEMVAILQDLLSTTAMLLFMYQSVTLIGGYENLITDNSRCPLGTPPLCCLRKCKRPKMTRKLMNLIFLPIKLIVVMNFLLLVVNMALTYNGFPPPKSVSDVTSIPSLCLAPFQLTAMYCYKVFMNHVEPLLKGTFPRTRGRLIFVTFILIGKTLGGVFSAIESFGWISAVKGLECINYAQLLLPLVQIMILLPISLILPRVYTKKWTRKNQVGDETKELDINETNLSKLEDKVCVVNVNGDSQKIQENSALIVPNI